MGREQGSSESRGQGSQTDVGGARLRGREGVWAVVQVLHRRCFEDCQWLEGSHLGLTWLQCEELIGETCVYPAR